MSPMQWRRAIGEAVWERLTEKVEQLDARVPAPSAEEKLSEVIEEVFSLLSLRLPSKPPVDVAKDGGRVFWPREDDGTMAVLTAEGLAQHWARKGHGFVLLRAKHLCRAAAGPLLQPLADLLQSYEYVCQQENVALLPTGWRAFVGGRLATPEDGGDMRKIVEDIDAECPTPETIIKTASARTVSPS